MIFESENMEKSIYSALTKSYPWTDTKKWAGLCFMLLLTGLTINHPAWARGGHDEGSVIGGGGDAEGVAVGLVLLRDALLAEYRGYQYPGDVTGHLPSPRLFSRAFRAAAEKTSLPPLSTW